MDFYNKHYIRTNQNGYIVYGFSDAFDSPLETDICIDQQGGRKFELLGVVNPEIHNLQMCYLYKYENGAVRLSTADELQEQLSGMPTPELTPFEIFQQETECGILENDFRICKLELGI